MPVERDKIARKIRELRAARMELRDAKDTQADLRGRSMQSFQLLKVNSSQAIRNWACGLPGMGLMFEGPDRPHPFDVGSLGQASGTRTV